MESDLPHPGDRPPSSPPGLEPGEGARRYEELADRLGVSFGQYQRVQCTLSWLPVPLAACALFSDSLYTLEPCHRCRETPTAGRGNTTSGHGGVTWGQRAEPCAIERCHNGTPQGEEGCPYGWEYEARGVLQHNIVTQWDLVCHRAWLVPIEEVIFILGCVFGSLVMGYLADRMGRRNTVMLSLMASILFGTLVAAAPNLPMFIFCRFLQGSAIAGLLLSLYVLRLELCDPPHRLVVAMVTGFLVVGGQFLLLGLALASREWRLLQAVITAPLGFFLVYCCPHVLLESPRWLVATSQTDEAKRVLAVMLEKGGRLPDREPLELEDTLAELDSMSRVNTEHSQQSACTGLWSRNIWRNIFILGFTTFIGHGIRHCYRTEHGNVSGSYLTYLLTAGTGALAILALCLTVDRFGRRGILLLAMTLTGLASLILLGLTEYLNNAAVMTFSILGLFSSHAVATLSVFFSAEVIPTVIRGEGLGLVAALASVGQLSSPVSELRNQHGYFLHHVLYASLAVLCSLCIMLLPESKRKPLPETVRDGELYRRPSLLSHRRDHVPLLTAPNPPV